MGRRNTGSRFDTTPAVAMAQYQDDCGDELLDAVITAAALVARADGQVEEVERGQLLDFLYRKRIIQSASTPAEILEVFDRRVWELSEPAGSAAALRHLKKHEDRSFGSAITDAGREIAAADGRLDPREQHVLQIIWITLGGPLPAPPAAENMATAPRRYNEASNRDC